MFQTPRSLLVLLTLTLTSVGAKVYGQQRESSATARVCAVRDLPATPGELALARKDFDAALHYYRAEAITGSHSAEAELGVVRSLIGKDQLAAALEEADRAIAVQPGSAVAEIAAGEAAYRSADFEAMREHAAAALAKDPCEARGLALSAQYASLHALFATEASLLATAHQLRPKDELIERAWIQSLPRKTRAVSLAAYLSGSPHLSAKDREQLTAIEDHLNARRPDECHITSSADDLQIPLVPVSSDRNGPGAYGLDVAFNGEHRSMQIDTGASGIVLTTAAAKQLGLEPEFRTHVNGVGDDGQVESYLAHVAKIRIGSVEVSNCLVEVVDTSQLGVDGLIGIDVFNRWLVTLDYQHAQLRLGPLPLRPNVAKAAGPDQPTRLNTAGSALQEDDDNDTVARDAESPAEMGGWLHMLRVGHELLLPSHIDGGPTHYLIADTGATQTLLSLPLAREAGRPREDRSMHIVGISGSVKKVYRINDATLEFGKVRLAPTSFSAFDISGISHEAGVEVSGLIGLPTLSRLTISIDYRDNLIQLQEDTKRDLALVSEK